MDSPLNFRPINRSPVSSRITAQLVEQLLLDFLPQNLVHTGQHGFLSFAAHIVSVRILIYVTVTISARKFLVVIFLDVTETSDHVSRSGLLTKIISRGFSDTLLLLFKFCLSKRNHVVEPFKLPHSPPSYFCFGHIFTVSFCWLY